MKRPILLNNVESRIYLIRSQKVMLDADLAHIYGVSTKRLNQQARRNNKRFPEDFMFQLTKDEVNSLRLQSATLEKGRGKFRKYLPLAFTEHGAVMLAAILHTSRAIEASIQIARAFVRLRRLLLGNKALAKKLNKLEQKIQTHDESIRSLFNAIRELITQQERPRRRIGFQAKKKG